MSNTTTCSSTTVKSLSLIEVMQIMHTDVLSFKEQLRNDGSVESIQQILDYIGGYTIDERLPETITTFIAEMITSNKDYSCENLCGELDMLATGLNDAIEAQKHQDNVAFVRMILRVMEKHAPEITKWLEEELQ